MVGTEDVVLVVLALAGQINSEMTLDLFLPTSGDRLFCGAMVERRDGPSWLRDDDDDMCHHSSDCPRLRLCQLTDIVRVTNFCTD